jgi:hypothetical protein
MKSLKVGIVQLALSLPQSTIKQLAKTLASDWKLIKQLLSN